MALSKESMATFIESRLAAASLTQGEGTTGIADAEITARAHLEAFCQGIIDEISTNLSIAYESGSHVHGDGNHVHIAGVFR